MQHLQQTSGVTTYDSTSNGNNGTKVSATSPAASAGEIGGAQSFDGSGDYIFNSGASNLPALNGSQTISMWLNYTSASSRAIAFGLPLNDGYYGDASTDLELLGGGNIGMVAWGGGAVISATAPASNVWHLVAYTYDGSTNSLYIDGVLQASNGSSPNSGTPTVFRIGSFNSAYPSPYWPGKVDEVRVSSVARAAGWIGTEYSNQGSPSAFYSVGGAQSAGGAATPTFSPAAGTYTTTQTVTIGTSTSGASIRYTTDGSTPTETAGTLYTGAITVSSTTTLNAVAYASGYTDSPVASATYTIQPAATPTFSPGAGTYSTTETVTIGTSTSGASIRYTTDGSTPTETAGTLYTGAIIVSSTTTVKAVAYESGYTDSSVGCAT